MDINKNLLEYGKLKLKEQEINSKISEEVKKQYFHLEEEKEQIQLFRYFDFNKHDLEYGEEPYLLEEWADEIDEKLKQETYDLLKLINERKCIRYNLGIKKSVITKYAIKLIKEVK